MSTPPAATAKSGLRNGDDSSFDLTHPSEEADMSIL